MYSPVAGLGVDYIPDPGKITDLQNYNSFGQEVERDVARVLTKSLGQILSFSPVFVHSTGAPMNSSCIRETSGTIRDSISNSGSSAEVSSFGSAA